MRIIPIIGILSFLLLGCGGDSKKPSSFTLKFGKASSIASPAIPVGGPVSAKEYKAAISSVIKKK